MKPLITFDVWGTLIKSNLEFSKSRATRIKNYASYSGFITLLKEDIEGAIKAQKKICDAAVERTGIHIDREDVYKSALKTVNVEFSDGDMQQIIVLIDVLFMSDFPPPLIHPNTAKLMDELSKHYTLGICSNTVLIYGNAIRNVLRQHNILQHFSPEHIRFSDEMGCSKPNKNMFLNYAMAHIGDNPVTDGACHKYGIEFIQINETNNLQRIAQQLLDVKKIMQ